MVSQALHLRDQLISLSTKAEGQTLDCLLDRHKLVGAAESHILLF